MKHVTVIIPTRRRNEKLRRCLKSIQTGKNVTVVVGFDGDFRSMIDFVRSEDSKSTIVLGTFEHYGSLVVSNMLASLAVDGVLCAIDDITFQKEGIARAVDEFNEYFPDDDGVLGIGQTGVGSNYCPTGVSLIGRKFLSRYKNKWPYYPGYFHFYGDKEVHICATKLGKFEQASEFCNVYHYHPIFHREEIDETHETSRQRIGQDASIYYQRQEDGLIWGFTDGIS